MLFGATPIYNLGLKISAPMHHYLLKQEYNVTHDLAPLFFKEGASKTEVLAALSRQKYSFHDWSEQSYYSRSTYYWQTFQCTTTIWVEFDDDDNLTSITGSTKACVK